VSYKLQITGAQLTEGHAKQMENGGRQHEWTTFDNW